MAHKHITMVAQYGVFLGMDVMNTYSGEIIDYHGEDEWYDTYEQARQVAEKYRKEIGQAFCSWGDDLVGVLRYVKHDDMDEPHHFQVYAEQIE